MIGGRRVKSLRWRLLVGTSLAAIAVLGQLGVIVYASMRHALMRDFDASLESDARQVLGMVDQDGAKVSFEFDARQMPDFMHPFRERYFEIWREDGSVLARSPLLGERDLDRTGLEAGNIVGVRLPDSHLGRMVLLPFTTSQQEQDDNELIRYKVEKVDIVVAAEPLEANQTLNKLAWSLWLSCAEALVVIWAVLLYVVDKGMKPVGELAGEIGSLGESDLGRRFAAGGVPRELAPMVEKLNGLMDRLQQAFAREKSFTADVAHELRTPLAGLRSTLEVCRSRPRDSAAYEAALDECRAITDGMEAMVQSLLLLARSDAGQVAVERRATDLSGLVLRCWNPLQYRADAMGLMVTLNVSTPCLAATDGDKLEIVLHNLFDNALSYVDRGGQIRISVSGGASAATIEVVNTGSQIEAADAPRLFERFWRGDAARADAGVHCGLGLSLSQRLVKLLGGQISIQTEKGGEFSVRLSLQLN